MYEVRALRPRLNNENMTQTKLEAEGNGRNNHINKSTSRTVYRQRYDFRLHSTGETTATRTDISSNLPPANRLPSSRARLPNGISSASWTVPFTFTFPRRFEYAAGLLSLTHRALEHSASLNIPASVPRPKIPEAATLPLLSFSKDGENEDMGDINDRLNRTTSSSISSSQRLSLNPSEAKMRMSSCCTGMENVCASCGRVGDAGPSCTGVLKFHHISSVRHTTSSPLTSIAIQSPKCAILNTAPPSGLPSLMSPALGATLPEIGLRASNRLACGFSRTVDFTLRPGVCVRSGFPIGS